MARRAAILILIATASIAAIPAMGATRIDRSAIGSDWRHAARTLRHDATLRLTDVAHADERSASVTLDLVPMQVVADDARLQLNGGMTRPLRIDRVHLSGTIVEEPGSRVTLALDRAGEVRGLIHGTAGLRVLRASSDGPLALSPAPLDDTIPSDEGNGSAFACGNDASLIPPADPAETLARAVLQEAPPAGYMARIALETDHEYFMLFGTVEDATAYAVDLVAFASTIYQEEADTALGLVSLSLWSEASDPWEQTGSLCRLLEFGAHWNENRTDVDRTLAHFLSGANLGGGVAWLGVLCQGAFPASATCPGLPSSGAYGGDYGVTGNIGGTFDIDNPRAMWDIVATSHEIGHNFNSPHTHCYAGIDGNPNDVDHCYNQQNGCYEGPASLPGPMGQGSGTIMSYCHSQSGGMSNIALTLGLDHPYGDAPQRVPDRMLGHVMQRESIDPGCLTTPLTSSLPLFADSFE